MPNPLCTDAIGSMTASRTTSASSSPRPCKASSRPELDVVQQAALFGTKNRDSRGVGLTVLTALANLLPALPEDEAYLALFHGARRVASDCDGQAPRRERATLESRSEPATLKRWLGRWARVRHRAVAERTVLTGITTTFARCARRRPARRREREGLRRRRALARLHQQGVRVPRLDRLEHAWSLLPTIVGQMVAARGAEESTEWRQPVDLVALCDEAAGELRELFARGRSVHGWSDHAALARDLLGDDPAGIVDAIKTAVSHGARQTLGRSLAYGAALRVARFGNANEHADCETAHHVFTYASALCQMLGRIVTATIDHLAAARGLLHGAMALYLARYLNVPPEAASSGVDAFGCLRSPRVRSALDG